MTTHPPRLGAPDALAAALALVLLGLHTAWLLQGSAPVEGDESTLLGMVACAHAALEAGHTDALWACPRDAPYPPLVPLSSALLIRALGALDVRWATLSLLPWEALLLWAAAWGARRRGGPWAAVAAVAFAGAVPGARSIWGHYFTELPMAALSLLCASLWDRSAGLQRAGPSLGLGLALGLGLMVKWTFGFFWAVPMALAFAWALGRAATRRGVAWVAGMASLVGCAALGLWTLGRSDAWPGTLGIGLALVMVAVDRAVPGTRHPGRVAGPLLLMGGAACTAGPWYLHQRSLVSEFLRRNLAGEFMGDPMPLAQTWDFYLASLVNAHGYVVLVLLAIGTTAALRHPTGPAARAGLAFACGALALTLAPYRAERYIFAGFGLLVPVMLAGLPGRTRLAPPAALAIAAAVLAGQSAWLAPSTHAARWLVWMQGAPAQVLFGNTADDVARARAGLWHRRPRPFTLLPLPIDVEAPIRAGLDTLAPLLPPGQPWLVHVDDQVRSRCTPCLSGELSLRGAGPGSTVQDGTRPLSTRLPHGGLPAAHAAIVLRRNTPGDGTTEPSTHQVRWQAMGLAPLPTRTVPVPRQGDVLVEVWAPVHPKRASSDPPR